MSAGIYVCVCVGREQARSRDLFNDKQKTDIGWQEFKAGELQPKKSESKQ